MNQKDLFSREQGISQGENLRIQIDEGIDNLDIVLIEKALIHAPSGNNAKAFEYFWMKQALYIMTKEAESKHYLNRNHHASLITLGCLVGLVDVAAEAQGFVTKCEMICDSESGVPGLKIQFLKSSNLGSFKLMAHVVQRSTYRGRYQKSILSQETVQKINQYQSSAAFIHVLENSEIDKNLHNYISKSEMSLWSHKTSRFDFLKGVRFFSNKSKEEVGIPSSYLGVGFFDQFMLLIFKKIPVVSEFLLSFPLTRWLFLSKIKSNLNHAHLVLFSSQDTQPNNLLNVGRAAIKVWLTLEQQGYKVQPLSSASLQLVDAREKALPMDMKPEYRDLYEKCGARILQNSFKSSQAPVWLFRFGTSVSGDRS